MKRNKFLLSLLATSTSPLIVLARLNKLLPRVDKGFIVKAGKARTGEQLKLKGVNSNIIDIKISGADTDGDLFVFEQTSISQGKGTPLHIHPFQDEIFYVLEGAYYFQVGEDKYHLNTGDSIFLPRKIAHAWTQVSTKGKMTVMLQPAGKLENFFITMNALKKDPSKEEIIRIFADNDMIVVGPAVNVD